LGTSNIMKGGSRDGNLSIWGLCWGSLGWAHLLGLRDMAEGVLGMESLSLWELCEGNLEGGLPPRNPEGYLEKSLGQVSLYTGAPLLGNLEKGLSTRTLRVGRRGFVSLPWGTPWWGPREGLLYWGT